MLYLDGYKREYAITIKLCSTRLIIRLEGTSGFTKAREAENLVNLILLIQGICCHFNDQQQSTLSVVQAKNRVCLLVQSEHVSIDKYYEEFKTLVAVAETYGGTCFEPGVVKKELTLASVAMQ